MTLINDTIENIKASVLVAIKQELSDAYPSEFGDYRTSRGDIYPKVFWSDTIRYQPEFPYCMLTINSDRIEGYDEISYFRGANNILKKRTVTRSFASVTIDIFDMGNENEEKTSLQADTFAHKVARQLRKYFNGDEKLDWFSGNEYYPRQISITIDSDINSDKDWGDTDTMFRYSFDINVGWDDVEISDPELAKGADITIYENANKIDNFQVKIGKNV